MGCLPRDSQAAKRADFVEGAVYGSAAMKNSVILFLDIDGVLNDHKLNSAGVCGIKPECVEQLNRILKETGCCVVLSSAWRYLIHASSMTLGGFVSMMRTHGADVLHRIIDITRPDVNLSDRFERGKQIGDWLRGRDVERYVVVDDDDEIGIPEAGHPFVKCDGRVGMTAADADKVIAKLSEGR